MARSFEYLHERHEDDPRWVKADVYANVLQRLGRNGDRSAALRLVESLFEYGYGVQIKWWRVRHEYAKLLIDDNRAREAVDLFEKWLSTGDAESWSWHQYGLALSAAEADPSELVRVYRHAIGMDPEQETWYYELGNAYSNAGDVMEAISAWERGLDVDPDSPMAIERLEEAYGEIGDEARQTAMQHRLAEYYRAHPDEAP